MNRRNFAKAASLAAVGSVISTRLFADSAVSKVASSTKPYKCLFAPSLSHCKASTEGMSAPDKIQFFYDCGFRALEDNGMLNRKVEEQNAMAKKMSDLGMTMGVFVLYSDWKSPSMSGNRPDISKKAVDKEAVRAMWREKAEKAVELAKRVNAKWCTLVPGLEDPYLEPEYQFANVVENLKYVADLLEPAGVIAVLEPLNIKNHPNLYLKRIPQAYAICKAVGSPSIKILDDLYHQQVTEGNLIQNIDTAWEEIAYFQQGDNPGRKEPGTGEINYKNVFKHIWDKGYRGILGMEHGQSDKTVEGDKKLLDSYRAVDVEA